MKLPRLDWSRCLLGLTSGSRRTDYAPIGVSGFTCQPPWVTVAAQPRIHTREIILMSNEQEPRELTPVQAFWDPAANKNFKDFSPKVVKVDPHEPPQETDEEVREAEEALTPAPKDSYAPESVTSPESPPSTVPSESASPVQAPIPPLPTQVEVQQEDADSESGKPSGSSADVVPPAPATPPSPVTSSPSSSTVTSPGKPTPPAPVQPPTSG